MKSKERWQLVIDIAGLAMLGLLLPLIVWFLLTQDLSIIVDLFR